MFLSSTYIWGQQHQPITTSPVNNWFFLHPKLSVGKWQLATELHLRRSNWILNNKNLLVRPYLTYKFTPAVSASIGYTYIHSWATPPLYGPTDSKEHNVWEQLSLTQTLGPQKRMKLTHRYRLEHRFSEHWKKENGEYTKIGIDFNNRFRYRITFRIALARWAAKNKQEIYLQFFDEVWINQHDYLLFKSFARNWFYAGCGWKFTPAGAIELGYMHQWDTKSSINIHTHIIQLALSYKFQIKKEEENT